MLRGGVELLNMNNAYNDIISLENLFVAWQEFTRGKKKRKDVAEFSFKLSLNIFDLHQDLLNKKYKHGGYRAFNISDPKPRSIHKATVRDRLLHHAVYRILYPYFDYKFIYDSYSCRDFKGTHRALNRFKYFARKVSENNSRTGWVLKCDIKKFFANIDHAVLLEILTKHISDQDALELLQEIIGSFYSTRVDVGLPLGNLTSQLLVNIYMNEFDQFIKHKLKIKYYIRYADDFVIFSDDREYLESLIYLIQKFLGEKLKLELHPDKVSIKTIASGVDFLGWVHFSDHRILRTATKRRMFAKIVLDSRTEVLNSYLGLLQYGNTWKIREKLLAGREEF